VSSRTFLVDLCNQNSLRAQPRNTRSPVGSVNTRRRCRERPLRLVDAAPPARAGLGGDLRTRLGPRPPHRPPISRLRSRALLDSGWRRGFHPSLADLVAEAREPGAFTRLQPRFHESGAGHPEATGSPRTCPAGVSAPRGPRALSDTQCASSWSTHMDEGFAPTRSARTPHVTRWSRHRVEIRCRRSSVRPKPRRRPAIPPHELVARLPELARGPLRTACSRTPPAVRLPLQAGSPRGPTSLRAIHSHEPHSAARHGWDNGLLAQPAAPGPRAASPVPPRRGAGSAAPEMPSIDGLRSVTTLDLRPGSLPLRMPLALAPDQARARSREPTWAGSSPQFLTSLWRHTMPFSGPDPMPALTGKRG